MRRRGRILKKKKKRNPGSRFQSKEEPEELKNAPHSIIIHQGEACQDLDQLTKDFRKVMEPFTASSLKATKSNSIRDFQAISGILHVTHICIFTPTKIGTVLKIVRTPRGPTLYFKVLNFSLAKDVISSLKKPLVLTQQYNHPPLAILNNFTGNEAHKKICASMLQNMFPSINLTKLDLNNVKRCALFNLDTSTDEIDFRHYTIKVVPVNISKGVKKMIQNKVPNLSKFEDPADFIMKGDMLSESEADDPESHVTLPQKLKSRGNTNLRQSSIRLIEEGPRMTLELLKIEEGFLTGEVLYHKKIHKTEEEKNAILQMRLEKKWLKETRKREQEERKKRKEAAKIKKEAEETDKKKKKEDNETLLQDLDDADWYKAEVGCEPDEDLFDKNSNNKRPAPFHDKVMNKRLKKDKDKIKGKKDFKKKNEFRNKNDFKGKNKSGMKDKKFRERKNVKRKR